MPQFTVFLEAINLLNDQRIEHNTPLATNCATRLTDRATFSECERDCEVRFEAALSMIAPFIAARRLATECRFHGKQRDMTIRLLTLLLLSIVSWSATPAESLRASVTVRADQPGSVIDPGIYGQFAEHLGHGIYEGIWVGENSPIPNTRRACVTMSSRR